MCAFKYIVFLYICILMNNNTISLDSILKNDDIALNNVIYDLKKRGWCFVKFSDLFSKTIQNISSNMKNFFELEKRIKEKYSCNYTIGYYELPFKQHFKVLTGNYNLPLEYIDKEKDTKTKEEEMIEISIEKLSKIMDRLMLKLTLSPVFNLTNRDAKYLSIFGENRAGLLDIVKYTPNINIKERPFYVNQHVDPGLFSLNIFSDASGMQFYDTETKLWYEMPSGHGAIFCGQAAKTLLNFTPAVHRVVNNGIGRMSIWYEVGIKNQIQPKNKIKKISVKNYYDNTEKKSLLQYKSSSNYRMNKVNKTANIKSPELESKSKFKSYVSVIVEIEELDNKEKKQISLYLPIDGTVMDIKEGIEKDTSGGMPSSKVLLSLENQQKRKNEIEKIKKRVNLIKNLDDKKFGNIRYWKLTMNGYLIPSIPPKPLHQQIWL
jgi:isopenicillin N synthase-like dioxygenase